jgi:hypothetical protein
MSETADKWTFTGSSVPHTPAYLSTNSEIQIGQRNRLLMRSNSGRVGRFRRAPFQAPLTRMLFIRQSQ